MWVFYRAFILRVKLNTDKEWVILYLYNFHQVCFRVFTNRYHTPIFKCLDIVIIKLVTVAVTLRYIGSIIDRSSSRTRPQLTLVGTEAHRAAHLGNIFLLLH